MKKHLPHYRKSILKTIPFTYQLDFIFSSLEMFIGKQNFIHSTNAISFYTTCIHNINSFSTTKMNNAKEVKILT